MKRVDSIDLFKDLRNNAVKLRNLKQTNLLLPENELAGIISAGRLAFHDLPKCLFFSIVRDNSSHLYFYINDISNIYIPTGLEKVCFNFFGIEGMACIWDDAVDILNLTFESKALKMSCKRIDYKFLSFTSKHQMKINNDFSYDYFLRITEPYFEPIRSNIPEFFEWENYKHDKTLMEFFDDKNMAGFCIYSKIGKRIIIDKIAVAPNYRGQGLAESMLCMASEGSDILQLWVHEDNLPAIRFYERCGLCYEKQYAKYYLGY